MLAKIHYIGQIAGETFAVSVGNSGACRANYVRACQSSNEINKSRKSARNFFTVFFVEIDLLGLRKFLLEFAE
jgi:hypothetical protein